MFSRNSQRNTSRSPFRNVREVQAGTPAHTNPEEPNLGLFPVAVMIMGVVSCYTTAVGLHPMLNNWILSYATAIALSIFMVSIALQFPRAYREGIQHRFILGYTFVAIFSVLLNFNAIYGVFSSEKLLYDELKDNKSKLTSMQVQAREALDVYYRADSIEKHLNEAKARLEEEKTNPKDYGYGDKARRINTEIVIPLEAQLVSIKSEYDPTIQDIDSTISKAQVVIEEALASGNLNTYRDAVDESIDAYTHVGELTQNLIRTGEFTYEPLAFKHRDVGKLNHSLWTIANLGKMGGSETSSVMVSLVLAILIDFIVLFVLVLVHKPSSPEQIEEEQLEKAAVASGTKTASKPVRQSKGKKNIYALRSNRPEPSAPVKYVSPRRQEQVPQEKPSNQASDSKDNLYPSNLNGAVSL